MAKSREKNTRNEGHGRLISLTVAVQMLMDVETCQIVCIKHTQLIACRSLLNQAVKTKEEIHKQETERVCYKSKDVSRCGKLLMDEGTMGNLSVTKIVPMSTSFFFFQGKPGVHGWTIILKSWCQLEAFQKNNLNWNNALIAQSEINGPFKMELSSQNSGNVEISHGSQQHTEGVMWSPPYHALENLSLPNMILVPWFPTLHPEPATVEEQARLSSPLSLAPHLCCSSCFSCIREQVLLCRHRKTRSSLFWLQGKHALKFIAGAGHADRHFLPSYFWKFKYSTKHQAYLFIASLP